MKTSLFVIVPFVVLSNITYEHVIVHRIVELIKTRNR